MRYFIDEVTHWDWQGYAEQLQALAPRLSRRAFATLSRTSFHDAQVLSIQVNNLGTTGRTRGKDPTEVVIHLWIRRLSCTRSAGKRRFR